MIETAIIYIKRNKIKSLIIILMYCMCCGYVVTDCFMA